MVSHPWLNTTDELCWSSHALERFKERNLSKKALSVTREYLNSLTSYTNNGCVYYCDTKNNVTYLVRNMLNDFGINQDTIVTVYYRNPIQMARRICEVKRWDFNCICRDHLFGNCGRGGLCRYVHKNL